MTIGRLHMNIARNSFAVAWICPAERPLNTWHVGVCFFPLYVQVGRIGRKGYGGANWKLGKGYWAVGAWS